MEAIEANYGPYLIRPYVPDRKVIPQASSDSVPLSASGSKSREVVEVFTAIATHMPVTEEPGAASVGSRPTNRLESLYDEAVGMPTLRIDFVAACDTL